MAPSDWDMILKRPRTARDQYTCMSETQIKNLSNDAKAFFHFSKPDKAYPDTGWYRRRHATTTDRMLIRGPPASQPFCWVDSQWQRSPPDEHNTCRLGASERWGPDKTGTRTIMHFNKPDDLKRYVNTELYRRHPTNIAGPLTMANGRPSQGYYAQRNPHMTTWFGSSVAMNRTQILQDIRPKTTAEYRRVRDGTKEYHEGRIGMWPEYSEYTDKYAMQTKVDPALVSIEARKRYLETAIRS